MKKFAFLSLAMIVSFNVFAECAGEAQFIAKVGEANFRLGSGCRVTITEPQIYNENPFCPLMIEDVNSIGIEAPVINGHECAWQPGDIISGVLVLKGDKIIIE